MDLELLPTDNTLKLLDDRIVIGKVIESLKEGIQELVVSDDRSFQYALNIWRQARDLRKSIDGQRKQLVEPYRKQVNAINDQAKDFTEPLENIETLMKQKIDAYQKMLEDARKAEEAKLIEAKELLGVDVNTNVPQITSMRGSGATVYKRSREILKINDQNLIPEKYWIIDEKSLIADLKLGIDVPGASMVFEETTEIRSR